MLLQVLGPHSEQVCTCPMKGPRASGGLFLGSWKDPSGLGAGLHGAPWLEPASPPGAASEEQLAVFLHVTRCNGILLLRHHGQLALRHRHLGLPRPRWSAGSWAVGPPWVPPGRGPWP